MQLSAKEQIRTVIEKAIKEAFSGIWEQEDAVFLEKLAQDIAEQKILAVTAPPEKKQEHEENIRTLMAHAQTEATRRYIVLYGQGVRAFTAAVKAMVTLIIHAAFHSI